MSISFKDAMLLERDDPQGPFDFSQLESLKELELIGGWAGINSTITSDDDEVQMWKPKNAFGKLPSNLDHLYFESQVDGFDLDGLASYILDGEHTGQRLLKSPQQLGILVDFDHHRPFNKAEQALEDKLKNGIHRLMTEWTLETLCYTQDHEHCSLGTPCLR